MTHVLMRRLLAVAFVAGLITAACSSAASHPAGGAGTPEHASSSAFPVTVTAANGSVHLDKQPGAILSLSPTATEMLYAIGAGSQVKGVDNDSNYPPQAPRTKLSGFTPNIEAIAAEKPDLVVVTDNAAMLTKKLAAFGIPVLALPAPPNVDGVYTEFDELGQATGHERQARS